MLTIYFIRRTEYSSSYEIHLHNLYTLLPILIIREIIEMNVHLAKNLEDEENIMLSILDPLHSKLQNIAKGCQNMHIKRDKLVKGMDKICLTLQ